MWHELVDELVRSQARTPRDFKITKSDYLNWRSEFVFEALQDHKFGPSFCSHYGIHDNILYYSTSVDLAEQYIRDTYLQQ